jgi:hypothetical protein
VGEEGARMLGGQGAGRDCADQNLTGSSMGCSVSVVQHNVIILSKDV